LGVRISLPLVGTFSDIYRHIYIHAYTRKGSIYIYTQGRHIYIHAHTYTSYILRFNEVQRDCDALRG